jgi:hypothetical protein
MGRRSSALKFDGAGVLDRQSHRGVRRAFLAAALLVLGLGSSSARASLFTGETLDSVANGIAWVALVLVPLIAIVVFWMVHVLPEKIAHKRHHPQTQAIQTLCLLSLVFGGLLWPIAWLWAYTKPVAYKLAYGTDKHDDYFTEMGTKAEKGELLADELAKLRHELDTMHAQGALTPYLAKLRDDLAVRPATPPLRETGSD